MSTIASKVNALNAKSGPFDSLILLGDVLPQKHSDLDTVDFSSKAVFTSGSQQVSYLGIEHKDIKTNLTYLGRFGIFTTTEGITIAFVTGYEPELDSHLDEILSKVQGKQIDILITYQWPSVIANEKELFFGNTNVDKIVKCTKPQYHFAVGSSSGKFFERSPFQWDDDSMTVTRFISLGQFESGEKWIYAFNINTTASESTKSSSLTSNPFTSSIPEPFTSSKKRQRDDSDLPPSNSSASKRPQRRVVLPENCFFCLSNPKLESHMIISIGEHAYLTIAKGPLTRPTKAMNFSGHCLIIPVQHIASIEPSTEGTSVIKSPLYNEIMRYQVSLVKFFDSMEMATVFFQINKSDSVHFHIQCFPIPADFLLQFQRTLEKKCQYNNQKLHNNTPLTFKTFEDSENEEYLSLINSKKDYISFTLFNGSVSKQQIFLSEIDINKSLDLQFGRRVLADLLQTPKRIKWDKCQQSRKVEEMETESFKKQFKSYDFTLSL